MSSLTSKKTKNINNRRRRRRKEQKARNKDDRERLAEHLDHKAPPVSRVALASFESMLEPTERRASEIAYQRLVADPVHAPLIGIPMAVAGVVPYSTKVRVRSRLVHTIGALEPNTISATISLFNCQGIQQLDDPTTWDNFQGNQLPKVTKAGAAEYVSQGMIAMVIEGDTVPAKTALYGAGVSTGTDGVLYTPPLGLELGGAVGRVVAQEVTFAPTNPALWSKGTVTMFQTINTGSATLSNRTSDELYSLQGVTAKQLELSEWPRGKQLKMVRVPQEPADFNFLAMDWSAIDVLGTPPPNGTMNNTSALWGAICLDGVKVDAAAGPQSFVITSTITYEILSSNFAFSTKNTASSATYELAGSLSPFLEPTYTEAEEALHDAEIHNGGSVSKAADAAVVGNMMKTVGPKTTAGTISHAQKGNFGKDLLDFGLELLPELLAFF